MGYKTLYNYYKTSKSKKLRLKFVTTIFLFSVNTTTLPLHNNYYFSSLYSFSNNESYIYIIYTINKYQ